MMCILHFQHIWSVFFCKDEEICFHHQPGSDLLGGLREGAWKSTALLGEYMDYGCHNPWKEGLLLLAGGGLGLIIPSKIGYVHGNCTTFTDRK